jgi:hypothetical protein
VAGCLGGSGDNGNESQNGDTDESDAERSAIVEEFDLAGDRPAPFREWVRPGVPFSTREGIELICQHDDYTAADGTPNLQQTHTSTASFLGVDASTLTGKLFVGPPPERRRPPSIVFGEFDTDQLVETFTRGDQSVTGTHGGYTVVENTIALGPDAVVDTPQYEQYIDTAAGRQEGLTDTDADATLLFNLLPAGFRIAVSRHGDLSDLALNGESRTDVEDGTLTRSVRAMIFESADTATESRVREILSSGSGFSEILTLEVHDRAAMVAYRP